MRGKLEGRLVSPSRMGKYVAAWRLQLWSLSGLGPRCSPPAGGGRADGWTRSQLSLLRACDAGGRLVDGCLGETWSIGVKDAGKREIRLGRG
jgi:hypothetical protein